MFDAPPPHSLHQATEKEPEHPQPAPESTRAPPPNPATGEKARARDILAAIRTLQTIEREHRPATTDERDILARFGGFGPVALSLFPDPSTGRFKEGWEELGEELRSLLTPQEYDSARRTVFSQFFTSPLVMRAMHDALQRLGVPEEALALEPGAGIGNFMAHAPAGMRFIGVELDSLSGRIARALHPGHDILIENFRDSKLPPLDAVIGNVPFADIKLEHRGNRFSLHDFFIAKSVDALKPGGVLAVVTSHYTLDKQNAAAREYLAERADFLGAIRLPSDAFKREGTQVVTDILFLRKRAPGQEPSHADADWLHAAPVSIEGADVPVNRYFVNHPDMVLGALTRKDTLYGGEGYSVVANGDLAGQLNEAVGRIAGVEQSVAERPNPPPKGDKTPHGGDLSVDFAENLQKTPLNRPETRFIPPPPLRHITEGSFFVGEDRVIRQVVDGQAQPVVYGGTTLSEAGTMTGKRLARLIDLRDKARRVLQSQNEGWPETYRQEARRDLNWAYDRFFHDYGPINRTSLSETKDGTTIRRMPNLVKFREDPDAMLVMALEEYDEETGRAEKAPILKRDVVGPRPPVDHVTTAEEGLLVSLDHKGAIDLPYISKLYGKPDPEIVAELGELIYRDPETNAWQTADAYLSGDVRAKLRIAQATGPEYARNAEALKAVQPEDVLPGDIDANLGAPWIPASDIQDFAAALFNVPPEAVKVGHLKKDAVWSVDPDYRAVNSVAATTDYGTPRINGTALLDLALNMRTPVIYDTIRHADREERVVNQTETLAAKEKQRAIKERFKAWVFDDPDRAERLVRIYNDAFNSLRPRLFDGSHLEFPGMSKAFELRQHQKDAVWRCMTGGNTLLAHVVGGGKSGCMIAAAMKMRQAGLVKKPMVIVPNHCLEQFAREFMQWYPNAKVLVATKDDFTRERRKALTAKIATGDWDAVVTTHSSFERIGMSRDYQERFLRQQIAEYESLLVDKASVGRNIIKNLEKQKAAREERLKNLLAEDKKDDGLVFDELGVDQIFFDESQAGKNLEVATKMDRVAGIQTGGSERAFDLYMKARYLGEKHPGHGVVFASGTPISNSMCEMYTQCRYLDPEGLRDRGIEHFDGWAATFGEIVEAMEISPDGSTLKPRARFAKFINLPELTQMFRSFADVQTAEMLDLPRPRLQGGKPQTIACPMSEEQQALQAELVKRYERIRNERVDPREDNALAITTDGRKLALDGRMLGAGGDFPGSKINALVANVARIWRETEPRRGTQMIFCDMGVNPTPWGFSAYDEVIAKLVESGIPRNQIANIGDADTDAKKQALFERVRQGQVRVLIGSTAKMGTGTNVQRRLVALHHLDAPWKPAEVEQREGRILRQGNQNEEVAIYRYVTEGSFDAYMWQALETKARFINQVMSGESAVRKAEDIGGQELSYAEVKAIASGNPAVLTLAEADAELQRLAILRKNHADEQFMARRKRRELPEEIAQLERRIAGLAADKRTVEEHADAPIVIAGKSCDAKDALALLGKRLEALPDGVPEKRRFPLGVYRGLRLSLALYASGTAEVELEGETTRRSTLLRDSRGPRAVLNAAERIADSYDVRLAEGEKELAVARDQLRDYESRLGARFAHEEYMNRMADLRDRLKLGLSERPPEGGEPVAELAERIKALRAENAVEGVAERVGVRKVVRAERPVTAKVRRREAEAQDGGAQNEPGTEPGAEPAVIDEPMPNPASAKNSSPQEVRAVPDHRQRVARRVAERSEQMRFF
jgi:N12 class adenine-specific DNA methylase